MQIHHGVAELYDAVLARVDEAAGVLIFDVSGTSHCLISTTSCSWEVGTIGRLRLPSDRSPFGFYEYPDQRLRRVPAHDDLRRGLWGWRVAERHFVAKAGIVPGKFGIVVPENTQTLVLEIPREFIHQCQKYDLTPPTVLRGFIADLCALMSWSACPREDGYSSNGSDERRLAQEYFRHAYSWLRET